MERYPYPHRFSACVAGRWLLWLLVCCGGLVACTSDESAATVVTSPGEDFEQFYTRFHADAAFQLERIQFPLQGVSSNPTEHGPDFRWQADEWQIHRPFVEASGFTSQFTRVGDDLVIERITDASGRYGLERRFARLDGESWLLIFYADLHPLG
jgi:hypothetical protein